MCFSSFEKLMKPLPDNVARRHFTKPTLIQRAVIPIVATKPSIFIFYLLLKFNVEKFI
jgi:superfamily II DNA/RNA helicase